MKLRSRESHPPFIFVTPRVSRYPVSGISENSNRTDPVNFDGSNGRGATSD